MNNLPKKKGGWRPGAGRKPHKIKGLLKTLPPDSAALILADIDANKKWRELAECKDPRVRLDTLKYLTDRAYGKAPQSIDVNDNRRANGAERLAELFAAAAATTGGTLDPSAAN